MNSYLDKVMMMNMVLRSDLVQPIRGKELRVPVERLRLYEYK